MNLFECNYGVGGGWADGRHDARFKGFTIETNWGEAKVSTEYRHYFNHFDDDLLLFVFYKEQDRRAGELTD